MQIKKRQVTEFIFDSFVLSSYQVTLGDLEIFNLSCKEHQKPSDEHSNFPGGDTLDMRVLSTPHTHMLRELCFPPK